MRKFLAVLDARNKEFVRDRGTLAWNLVFPFLILVAFMFMFGRGGEIFTVSVLAPEDEWRGELFEIDQILFVEADDPDDALAKVGRHQVDMVVDPGPPLRYWVNSSSSKGAVLETLLQGTSGGESAHRETVEGNEIRYVDWALPGILGMNVMFSCLIGVGFVIVRYRKSGVLRRLKATPLSAFEFLCAQIASRMLLVLLTTAIVYGGSLLLLGLRVEGSHLAVFTVYGLGSFSLVSLGLVFACRTSSEELAGGLMNLMMWPMMLLSEVFVSLEGSPDWVRSAASVLPLTQIVHAARAIMTEGASLFDVAPSLLALVVMSAVFLTVGSLAFRWE